ncbi:Uncharacterised protein [Mycobacterium tuberculosis]|uniref:Uncharacterized protein n=1 Tax=Mycobacterium tuberculosis TaxID=1773 RepID=A0A654U3T5_MYCTX|nr:Uncharacterised protein [Mycobacterium tuberculosis]CFS31823.1 Uncharacterised protein [Mycobacterium tuberculosis]CKQ35812.1 Uncharacterised protein [Mycobacterium tuberculosis]COW45129.1 Uncharacterised protein [Mycobacterium tuberculosis]COW62572.1 Uncharacterised protein [Mycobacterium tuberculosis]
MEDLLPQWLKVRGGPFGVVVFSFEVGDYFRAVLVAQPFIWVDKDVAVVLPAGLHPLGHGR